VDLLIRTAEQRLSDFLLWQCAFAEIFFCDQLFPDFTPQNFDQVWAQFPNRVRRYGH
jgi:undecaprenyl diphosphate synthase